MNDGVKKWGEQAKPCGFGRLVGRADVTAQLFEVGLWSLDRVGGSENQNAGFTYHVDKRTEPYPVCFENQIIGYRLRFWGYGCLSSVMMPVRCGG